MKTITLERRNPDNRMWREDYQIVDENKYGFSLRKPRGNKVYDAVRNQQTPNWITVLNGRGRIVFQGMIVN